MSRKLIAAGLAVVFAGSWLFASSQDDLKLPVTPGPFMGTMDSLTNYSCPEWFRDAKFGIWAHWGPQSVPEMGDWYARKMYEEGSADYADHLKRWGHPSTNGWKDIIPLWKAEKWEPDQLMALYKKAGARYFVSMGSHHDDFFLWGSKLHKWNSVQVGPHRDVVGEWQAAAKKNGLPFGVSEHLGASFSWFQDSHKSDKTGPLAGVPYDGANSNYWDLYHFPAKPGDTGWYSKDPRWQQQWYDEIRELVDNYHPDLLYSDGGVPFGNTVGLTQIANFYNVNAADHGGKCEAVYTCKEPGQGRWVQDYERGVGGGISPYPWQTDTSIGDWFYNKNWKYQPLSWVVHMLVDIVSKNGNLLLNVVQRPDGSLDPQVVTMLHQLADWTAVNGEAIYGTRPWQIYGEGPMRAGGGAFNENFDYTARDIRFTTKGATLYAIAMGWPEDNQMVIRSLAATEDPAQNHIQKIELLGHNGELKFTQTTNGLVVSLPAADAKPDALTCSLRIIGTDLKPVPVTQAAAVIAPDANGRLVLHAEDATLHGNQIRLEAQGGKPDIGFWDRADEWVSWRAKINRPGVYRVAANIASADGPAAFVVEADGQRLGAHVPQTAGWGDFVLTGLGTVEISQPGEITVIVRAKDAASWQPINLNSLQLEPAGP